MNNRLEQDMIPFHTGHLSGTRILVVAPHPDDETLGCAGTLMKHVSRGEKVRVLFLTDGSGGDFSGLYDSKNYIKMREEEASGACNILGIEDFEFLRFPDRKLGTDSEHMERLGEEIKSFQPDIIYVTSPIEINPDHRAAANLVWDCVMDMKWDLQLVFYEISTPLQPNLLVDITELYERKKQAASCYISQMKYINYADMALSLNRFRSLTVAGTARYAEAYFVLNTWNMIGKILGDFFDLRKIFRGIFSPKEPLVSIIVRTKDRPELLKEALVSLENQTYKDMEVIVVNDGGTSVETMIKSLGKKQNIRLIEHSESLGRASAANSGLKNCSGELIGFLDDDDLFYPDHIQSLVEFILKEKDVGLVYSDCLISQYEMNEDNSGIHLTGEGSRSYKGIHYDRERLYMMNYIPVMTALFRRDLLAESGYLDESLDLFEDWDLWIRMSMYSEFRRLPKITCEYRIIGARSYDYLAGQIRIYEKYWQIYTPRKIIEWLHKTQGENDLLREQLQKLKGEGFG